MNPSPMHPPGPPHARWLRALWGWSLLLLGGCGIVAADGAAPAPITEIRLERDCFGCPQGSVLVLRRDGSALHTRTGKARHGTEDQPAAGTVDPSDFSTLARLLEREGFFAMQPLYEDAAVQDGAWSIVRVTRGDLVHEVIRRVDAGPPALRRIESAIEALHARIRFDPLPQ